MHLTKFLFSPCKAFRFLKNSTIFNRFSLKYFALTLELIEGSMSHTRTPIEKNVIFREILPDYTTTQINILGWYDNEFGNDVCLLGETVFFIRDRGFY